MGTELEIKEFCQTSLPYLPRDGGQAPGQLEVTVRDARAADLPGWADCGFELVSQTPSVADWDDDDAIATAHYPEMIEQAREMTGCDHALLTGHIKRSPQEAQKHQDLAPIRFVHSDFADSYGDLLRELHSAGERADAASKAGLSPDDVKGAEVMVLQFWRNIGPAKMDLPLAFCDARTVPRDDVRAFEVKNYAGGGFDFEALGILAPADPADHHWYVFPEMQVDEVVAFRTYDSRMVPTGEPYWTPHTAISDPEVEPGKPARSSIELRATCLFL